MPHAEIMNDRICVQTHWNEAEQIKMIPGSRWNQDLKMWHLPITWVACLQLRGVFGPSLTVGPKLVKWSTDERDYRVTYALDARGKLEPRFGPNPDDNLYPFQAAGVDFLDAAVSSLLADEMGTGKTIQTLVSAQLEAPVLVVCPNSVKHNWAREARKWARDFVPYVVEGGAVGRKKILDAAAEDPNALVIVNFEALRMHTRLAAYGSQRLAACVDCDPKQGFTHGKTAKCERHPRELNKIPFKVVVVDEAHRIKDPHAKQTRAAWAVGENPSVERRIALTGTPIANDPSDLWSIMHFVEPAEYPVKTKFVDRYCLVSFGVYGGLEVVGVKPEAKKEFYSILDPRFRRLTKAEVLPQLPPKIRTDRVVQMSPKQKKAYDDIERGLVTRLPDGNVMVAPNDLVARTRLLQFASATMEATEGGFRMCDPSSKVDQLLDDLDDLGYAQVAVCAMHKQLINLAAARLARYKISFGLITGDQQPWERELFIRDFQAGKISVILFTLAAGGTGITLTAAGTLIRMQRSWSMIDNLQGEDRVHRIGSEIHRSINIIDYVADGTVEDDQRDKLWRKSERLEEINRDRARLKAAGLPTEDLDLEENKIVNSDLGE